MPEEPHSAMAYFGHAAELVSDAIEVVDEDGRYMYVNPAWERLTGYTAADAQGQGPAILRSAYHPVEFYDAVEQGAWATGGWAGELVSRRKDGALFFARLEIRRLPGKPASFIGIRRDLTGELRGIREHAERYAMALLATRDGLVDWDPRSGVVIASDRWREIAHVTGDGAELLERFRQRVHPDDLEDVTTKLFVHLASSDHFFECEVRLLLPNGAVAHLDQRAVTLRDPDGHPVRVIAVVSDISARKESDALLLHNATHDPLTDLPNRVLFVQQLRATIGRAARIEGPAFALLYIDLRQFKRINDAYGHAVGDAVLQSVARRLERSVRPGDSAARLGGDEFAMLLDGVRSPAVADAAARRVLRSLERDHDVEGHVLECAATIGVSIGSRDSDVDQLVRAADSAMYEARMLEAHAVRVASPDGAERSLRRARMANALRDSLVQRRIEVHYQPLVEIGTGELLGVEALARWNHPDFDSVSPGEFVPLAEDTRLAGRLGQLVLELALDDRRAWQDAGLLPPGFRLHVNVSPKQLLDPRFPTAVARFRDAGLVGTGKVCFEITETALVERPDVVSDTIRALNELGVSFFLDDFGTGFSSLSHLRGFAVSGIKIDRSFVAQLEADPVSRQIVSGLMTMTQALGLDVVAEGVENAEQERILLDLGCRRAQGYRYARPMPAPNLEDMLRSRLAKV